jgi:hypothetical protein
MKDFIFHITRICIFSLCTSCLTMYHIMKAYWGEGIVPRTLNLGTTWRWLISLTSRPLYPRSNCHKYPLDRRLGGLKTVTDAVAKRNISHHWPFREMNPSSPVHNLAPVLTDLHLFNFSKATYNFYYIKARNYKLQMQRDDKTLMSMIFSNTK